MQRRQHQMARHGCPHGYLCCFSVTNLSNLDYIRVLPKNRPQDIGKTPADVVMDLYLCNALDLILDRVFDGNDIPGLRLHMIESGIEGRCLSAPCRSCYNEHPLRTPENVRDRMSHLIRHAEFLESYDTRTLVEQPDDNLLPVNGGDR